MTEAPPVDWTARLAEADGLYAAGHYAALREALRIYGEALAAPVRRAGVAEKYLRASLALELRKKDLGILTEGPAVDLDTLAADDPSLARYAPWLELVAGLPNKIKGIPGIDQTAGRTLDAQLDWVRRPGAGDRPGARGRGPDRRPGGRAPPDPAPRILSSSSRTSSTAQPSGTSTPARGSLAFQAAVCPAFEAGELEVLLRYEPGFVEVHYYLGEEALLAGQLLTAERHYLAVHEKIPESLSVIISMAKVAFQMEETEACLEWNEKALALLPVYRDALLGKGLALGYLGRNEEALTVLGRLLELGTYYMGEGHFWSAWNRNELGRLEEARRSIESAKVFLVGMSPTWPPCPGSSPTGRDASTTRRRTSARPSTSTRPRATRPITSAVSTRTARIG